MPLAHGVGERLVEVVGPVPVEPAVDGEREQVGRDGARDLHDCLWWRLTSFAKASAVGQSAWRRPKPAPTY